MPRNCSRRSVGVNLSTRLISKRMSWFSAEFERQCIYSRSFLETYKKCNTAADIDVAQGKIMAELEASWNESRKQKGLQRILRRLKLERLKPPL